MTNPGNAIGTNGAYGGRTSVNAFNDNLATYAGRCVLSGWECVPKTGLTIQIGGNGTTRDVAIAQDDIGNRTTINNISASPIDITLATPAVANPRIDTIVAYVTNPPQVTAAEGTTPPVDNPEVCGIIAVSGTAAASPNAPTESAIRTAITADGGSGTTAYYVELAQITVPAGATDIVVSNITNMPKKGLSSALTQTDIVQVTGQSTTTIMSQKSVTDSLGSYQPKITYGSSLPSTGTNGQIFILI